MLPAGRDPVTLPDSLVSEQLTVRVLESPASDDSTYSVLHFDPDVSQCSSSPALHTEPLTSHDFTLRVPVSLMPHDVSASCSEGLASRDATPAELRLELLSSYVSSSSLSSRSPAVSELNVHVMLDSSLSYSRSASASSSAPMVSHLRQTPTSNGLLLLHIAHRGAKPSAVASLSHLMQMLKVRHSSHSGVSQRWHPNTKAGAVRPQSPHATPSTSSSSPSSLGPTLPKPAHGKRCRRSSSGIAREASMTMISVATVNHSVV